jgi:hypothetical protein
VKKRIVVAVVLVVLLAASAYAQTTDSEKYVPKPNEELYGTWVNEQNSGEDLYEAQKVVVSVDAYRIYRKVSDSVPGEEGPMEIVAKWSDSEDNVWYKTRGTDASGIYQGMRWQELDKLSKHGTVWERALNRRGSGQFNDDYPTEIYPKNVYPFYRILFRAGD